MKKGKQKLHIQREQRKSRGWNKKGDRGRMSKNGNLLAVSRFDRKASHLTFKRKHVMILK